VYRTCASALLATALFWFGVSAAGDRTRVTDPTAPPYRTMSEAYQSPAGDKPLLLYSTQVATSSRSAVVNNQVVAVGSYIDGAVVTAIEQGQVTLTRGTEAIVLRLLLPSVKRPAKDGG